MRLDMEANDQMFSAYPSETQSNMDNISNNIDLSEAGKCSSAPDEVNVKQDEEEIKDQKSKYSHLLRHKSTAGNSPREVTVNSEESLGALLPHMSDQEQRDIKEMMKYLEYTHRSMLGSFNGEEEESFEEMLTDEDESFDDGISQHARASGGVEYKVKAKSGFDADRIFVGFLPDCIDDVGGYSYLTLIAVVMFTLFEDNEQDRDYVTCQVRSLGEHLHQPTAVIEAAVTISRGDGILITDPLVESLKQEKLVHKYGLEVIVFDFIDFILKQGVYDSRARSVVRLVSQLLKVDWEDVEQYEDYVVLSLEDDEHEVSEEEANDKDLSRKRRKMKKYLLVGAAAVGGGTLIGVTGGLAAPLIAVGAQVLIGTGAAAIGTTAGAAIIGTLFGAAGASLMSKKMKTRVGDLEECDFEPLTEGRQLHITIAVSGWLTEENHDFKNVWRGLANSTEQYVLRYESKYLINVGSSMGYFVGLAAKFATKQALAYTALATLVTALGWPITLLAASNIIDNPWSVAMTRSRLAGKVLADKLIERQQGKRPVTLMGFSLGARVIYYCLKEMSKRSNSAGIIEDVVLLGAPCTGEPEKWKKLKNVVAGKIVNGYCQSDWLLRFLYRTASAQYKVAGLAAIDWQDRRMHNMDLTDVVNGHLDYMEKIDEILEIIGVKTRPHVWDHQEDSLKQWCKVQHEATLQDDRYNIKKVPVFPSKGSSKSTAKSDWDRKYSDHHDTKANSMVNNGNGGSTDQKNEADWPACNINIGNVAVSYRKDGRNDNISEPKLKHEKQSSSTQREDILQSFSEFSMSKHLKQKCVIANDNPLVGGAAMTSMRHTMFLQHVPPPANIQEAADTYEDILDSDDMYEDLHEGDGKIQEAAEKMQVATEKMQGGAEKIQGETDDRNKLDFLGEGSNDEDIYEDVDVSTFRSHFPEARHPQLQNSYSEHLPQSTPLDLDKSEEVYEAQASNDANEQKRDSFIGKLLKKSSKYWLKRSSVFENGDQSESMKERRSSRKLQDTEITIIDEMHPKVLNE